MQVHAVKAFEDNYIWVLSQDGQAVVIDAGESAGVMEYLTAHQLNLQAILITHHHHDHTGGVQALSEQYPTAQIIAHAHHGVAATQTVQEGDCVRLLGHEFWVYRTAGHTDNHLSYGCHFGGRWHIFCGDTLFSGGCGRVFTGTIEDLFASFERFDGFPEDTLFYPAHEYTLNNLKFGLSVCNTSYQEDFHAKIQQVERLIAQGLPSLPTSLAQERLVNVFLQVQDDGLIHNVKQRYPLADESPVAVFGA